MNEQQPTEAVRLTGTVKWFDPVRRYGFIVIPGASDAFVHASDIFGGTTLETGDEVSFELVMRSHQGRGRVQALMVRRIGPPMAA